MKKLLVSLMLLAPSMAMAQAPVVEDDPFGRNTLQELSTAGESKDIFVVISNIVNIILTFLGAIAVLLFLYGGFKWFTSQGNSEQIEAAKKIMGAAVVGLAIIFASYAAAQYIFDQLSNQLL
ncbi:MAG: pilin [Patescibacteria group bacterium]